MAAEAKETHRLTDGPITVQAALTPSDFGPMVVLASGGEDRLVLTPDEARSFALCLMDMAARAEAESLLCRWLEGIPGMNEGKREAALGDFRALAATDLYKSVRKAHQEAVKEDEKGVAG